MLNTHQLINITSTLGTKTMAVTAVCPLQAVRRINEYTKSTLINRVGIFVSGRMALIKVAEFYCIPVGHPLILTLLFSLSV